MWLDFKGYNKILHNKKTGATLKMFFLLLLVILNVLNVKTGKIMLIN